MHRHDVAPLIIVDGDVVLAFADDTRHYLIQWGNGPTCDGMRDLLAPELDTGGHPDLPRQIFTWSRGYSPRAFAARAAAARRDRGLARAVEALKTGAKALAKIYKIT